MSDLFDFFEDNLETKRFDVLAAAANLQDEDIEFKRTKLDTFKDFLPSILNYKKYIFDDEKDYQPFLVNKMVSYHVDGIFHANQMNMMHQLPKRMQYDFYYHSIRAKKRGWTKWIKPVKAEDLAAVKLYFRYSDTKAAVALNILSEEDLVIIRKATADLVE